MDELIQTLVADYKADRVTWHDIQDIVGAYRIRTYGVIDYDKDREKWLEAHKMENNILQEIGKRI